MWYLNSAVNPILYNLMSSKFRKGFFKLCRCWLIGRNRHNIKGRTRAATFNTTTTSSYLTHSCCHHHNHHHHHRCCQDTENNSELLVTTDTTKKTLSLDDLRNMQTLVTNKQNIPRIITTSTSTTNLNKIIHTLPKHNKHHIYCNNVRATAESTPTTTAAAVVVCNTCNLSKKNNTSPPFSPPPSSGSSTSSSTSASLLLSKNHIKENDLRKLAFKNSSQKRKTRNISLEEHLLCKKINNNGLNLKLLDLPTSNRADDHDENNENDDEINENNKLSCKYGRELQFVKYIDETSDDSLSSPQSFIPLLNGDNDLDRPILSIASYQLEEYIDGSEVAVCLTSVETFWPAFFFIFSITVFFFLPLLILIVLYSVIAKHLMENPGIISQGHRNNVLKYRKQVIFMLGAVVLSFFLCLLPFRALTLWIIVVPTETILQVGIEGYYNLLYFSRIMHYLNSAMNPILYNLMSSKFREGFLRLLGCKSMTSRHKLMTGTRKGTFHTTSTNLSSSNSEKRRELRRTSVSKRSIDESSSTSNNETNGIISNHTRKLSFEDASGNIVKCARAILLQNNVIEELDESTTSPQEPSQEEEKEGDVNQIITQKTSSYQIQTKQKPINNSYKDNNVLLYNKNVCISNQKNNNRSKKRNKSKFEDRNSLDRAILSPLLEQITQIENYDKETKTDKTWRPESDMCSNENLVVETNVVRILEESDADHENFLEIDLENLRNAKESLKLEFNTKYE
uniref:CSON001840 protein n=1 Tax=Culicoides sonorensis TaxID=179676 RepID=A0A336MIZ1_CULSO